MVQLLLTLAVLAGSPRAPDDVEVARIRAHLVGARAYATSHDVSGLELSQRARRAASLAALDRYIERGQFPARTNDGFAGYRPRFIDARGVHCAVGYLIAASGAEELARAINRDFEYAYVADIDSPALLTWANEHGFTLDELARIQPAYRPPPTSTNIRRGIEETKDDLVLACVAEKLPAEVVVRAVGNEHGAVQISTDAEDSFSRCFAHAALDGGVAGGGAYRPSPDAFDVHMTFALRTPNQILDRRMREQIGIPPECAPRPGALSRQADVSLVSEDGQLAIHVTTSPSNAAINTCITDYLAPKLAPFKWIPDLAWKHRYTLRRMESGVVRSAIAQHAPGIATDCLSAEAPATELTIHATAAVDDKRLSLTTSAPNEAFSTCVVDKLQPTLRRVMSNGSYFRIDNTIDATATFTIETKAERDKRRSRERKAMEQRRKQFEEERKRKRYGF